MNNNKKFNVVSIIAAILPTLYAIAMILMPFLDLKVTEPNAWGIPETHVTHLKLFQLYNDSRMALLLAFVMPVVLSVVATLLCLIVRKKGSFIYECVATTIATAFNLSALVLLQSVINAVIEAYKASDFVTVFGKFFIKVNKDVEVEYGYGYGFWLALIFAAAALVMSLVTIKMMNDGAAEAQPAGNAARSSGAQNAGANRAAGGAASAAHQIVCISGEFANASFPINPNETVVIGRDSAVSNIVIVAPKVSRKHCTISFDSAKNMFIVVDCSTNGTYTENGTRLMANMNNPLPSGTVISLGSNENRFRLV